jgi:DNA-directed RNA polymerase specialized sigma subunit
MAIYVKNSDLRNEIIKCKETNVLSDDAIRMFQKMAERFSRKLSYIYEEDRQDCISVAVIDCYLYWRNYDPSKSMNAFAYFTSVIRNGTAKSWRKITGGCPKSKKVSLSNNDIYNF